MSAPRRTWRQRAAEVIARVHASLPPDATTGQRREALRDAYPFGERSMHPYKVWLDETKRYLALHGDDAILGPPRRFVVAAADQAEERGQLVMFEEAACA